MTKFIQGLILVFISLSAFTEDNKDMMIFSNLIGISP